MLRVKLMARDTQFESVTAMISEDTISWMLGLVDELVNVSLATTTRM